jgi:4-amino-4-deoxy-L-arabinose transferase-like glycosyltransferase
LLLKHLPLEAVGLTAALTLSALLNLVGLNQEGFGNTYYAAAVWSMLQNWHAFIFGAFDSAGFITVDKPPLGLWLQVLSAKLFGFSGLSILAPQAIAGVACVGLVYLLVRRIFGPLAATIAAFVLAVTPITVVTDRNNTMDATLVLVLLLAAYAVSRAAEAGSLRSLLLAAALIGLAFNIKMLQAYPVVPAFGLAYVAFAPLTLRKRASHLLLAAAVLLVVSLSWSVFVDLTPASARPFVGSSGSNSALSLALGYNGLSRITLAIAQHVPALSFLGEAIDLSVAPLRAPGIGNPGVLRLFQGTLADQASWLLGLALIGLLVGWWQAVQRTTASRTQHIGLVVWGGWLLTWSAIFSFSRFYHLYYLIMLGPAIAALSGIGIAAAWQQLRAGRAVARWLLPLALLCAAWLQIQMLHGTPWLPIWATTVLVIGSTISAIAFIAAFAVRHFETPLARTALSVGIAALLVAPLVLSVESVQNGNGGGWLVQAGPNLPGFAGGGAAGAFGRGPAGFGGFGATNAMTFAGSQWNQLDQQLVNYLEQNQGSTQYLVATQTSSYASLFVLNSHQPALALGGYQGWDGVLEPADLQRLVQAGVVRFFYLAPDNNRAPDASLDATADLTNWVQTNCSSVPASTWGGSRSNLQLYDCAPSAT